MGVISNFGRLKAGVVLSVAVVAAAWVSGAGATDTTLSFQGSKQNFGVSVAITGTATVDGTGTAKVWVPIPLLGYHQTVDFDIDRQSIPLDISRVFTSIPTGSTAYSYDPQTLLATGIAPMHMNLQNGGNWGIPLPRLKFRIHAETDVIGIPISISADLNLDLTGSISKFLFDGEVGGTAENTFGVDGSYTGGIHAVITGELTDVPLLGSYDLGELSTIDEEVAEPFPFFGDLETADLQKNRPRFPHDMSVHMSAVLPISLELPTDLTGTISEDSSVPDEETGFSRLRINYDVHLAIAISNLHYDMKTTALNTVGAPDFLPAHATWDLQTQFGFTPNSQAIFIGAGFIWGYGNSVADGSMLPFDAIYADYLGAGNFGWAYAATPGPGIVRLDNPPPPGLAVIQGDTVVNTGGAGGTILQWTCPANVHNVNFSGVVWDADEDNKIHDLVVTKNIPGTGRTTVYSDTVDATNGFYSAASFLLKDVAVNQGDQLELRLNPRGSNYDTFGVHYYIESTDILGRSVGDFDNSGCTDIGDFLFLMDHWQLPDDAGGIWGIDDFLALLDGWQQGVHCV